MNAKQHTMRGAKVFTFIVSVAIPLVVGFISSMLSGDLKAQYNTFTQPPLSPPDWLFGLMWPVLYILMGIACYLVITADIGLYVKFRALSLYAVQLVLNALWSPIFFAGDYYWGAFAVIAALDLLVLVTVMQFGRINKLAGVLLVPYLAWILFATYLNVGIAVLN